jgi:hypothetical protein
MLTEDVRRSLGAFELYDLSPREDDDVLDQWLASLTPDELEHMLDDLAILNGLALIGRAG